MNFLLAFSFSFVRFSLELLITLGRYKNRNLQYQKKIIFHIRRTQILRDFFCSCCLCIISDVLRVIVNWSRIFLYSLCVKRKEKKLEKGKIEKIDSQTHWHDCIFVVVWYSHYSKAQTHSHLTPSLLNNALLYDFDENSLGKTFPSLSQGFFSEIAFHLFRIAEQKGSLEWYKIT